MIAIPGSRHVIHRTGLEGMAESTLEDPEVVDGILLVGEAPLDDRALRDRPPERDGIGPDAVVLLAGEGVDRVERVGAAGREDDVAMDLPRDVAAEGPEVVRRGIPPVP